MPPAARHRPLRVVETGTSDPGLFGPSSVTWRVHAQPVMLVGGISSLLLQALHPVALHGVVTNSKFRDDPWGRLARTAEHVGKVTFGTTAEAEQQGMLVRRIHSRLHGVEPRSGRAYRVDDPDLLLWVHCAEVSRFVEVAVQAGLRLSGAEVDRYYAEQVTSARLVGLDTSLVPSSRAEMADYFTGVRDQLAVTRATVSTAKFVTVPPMPRKALPVRPLWGEVVALAYGSLPRWARHMYRVPTLPLTTTLGLRSLRLGLGLLPIEGPHLTAARARLDFHDPL